MKCDVCLTKIPIGQNECPNCGFVVKKNHVNTYDASGNTHEHIQVQSKSLQNRLKNIKTQQQTIQRTLQSSTNKKQAYQQMAQSVYGSLKTKNKKKKSSKKGILFIVIFCIFMTIGIIMPVAIAFISEFEFDNDVSYVYDNFEDMIDSGIDEYGSIELANTEQVELKKYLEDHSFTNIENRDYYDDNFSSARSQVDAYRNDIHYRIIMNYEDGKRSLVEITLSGFVDSTDRSQLAVQKDDISIITDYLNISSLYNHLSYGHSRMTTDNSKSYTYSNYDGEDTYMSETVYDDYYSFYYSSSFFE